MLGTWALWAGDGRNLKERIKPRLLSCTGTFLKALTIKVLPRTCGQRGSAWDGVMRCCGLLESSEQRRNSSCGLCPCCAISQSDPLVYPFRLKGPNGRHVPKLPFLPVLWGCSYAYFLQGWPGHQRLPETWRERSILST